MAITSSAKKAIRSSEKKHVFNLRRKDALYNATKSLTKALAAKDVAGAEKLLPKAYAAIDKACKTRFYQAQHSRPQEVAPRRGDQTRKN